MRVIRDLSDLKLYIEQFGIEPGCFADTGFLYAIAYDDDQFHSRANDVHDLLAENQTPIFANVISRMEFIDLIFRKQVTNGAVQVFEALGNDLSSTRIFKLLRSIRDQNTAQTREKKSFKVSERQLKDLRHYISQIGGNEDWKTFCSRYCGQLLVNEWRLLESEFGLNFVEVMEGQASDLFNQDLRWADMVELMAAQGMRGPDAMILNLFSKSKFPLLITSDKDFLDCVSDELSLTDKAIFLL
jgi:predicted nucleic acid-binding protein